MDIALFCRAAGRIAVWPYGWRSVQNTDSASCKLTPLVTALKKRGYVLLAGCCCHGRHRHTVTVHWTYETAVPERLKECTAVARR